MVRVFRYYFERAPGWVLLTTRGRKTGLPREVLLPCERTPDGVVLISTYGRRSNWMRNLERDPDVHLTCAGWVVAGRAEIILDPGAKRALVSAHPFFPALPIAPVHLVIRGLLRPLLVVLLRRWVGPRPVVVIRQGRAT